MLPQPRGYPCGRRLARLLTILGVGVALWAPACSQPVTPSPPPSAGGAILVGAGDIALCGTGAESTARLLDLIEGTVFTAGDNAYPMGTQRDFLECYDPTWGRHKHRTRPVPGNHDYGDGTHDGRAYFNYFGEQAGPSGLGYYAYDVGSWKVVALNSEIDTRPGSPQMLWLRSELENRPNECTVAIWHKPLFSSGPNGPHGHMRDMYRLLYQFRADVVISGHDHIYERFAPQDADGRRDDAQGLTQFVVGTGGVPNYVVGPRQPNSEVAQSVWGVLKLALTEGQVTWEFIPVRGSTFTDSGARGCH